LCSKTWADIKDYPGNYTDFREKQKQLTKNGPKKDKRDRPQKPDRKREKAGLSFKEKKEFEALESDIEALEAKKAALLDKMNAGMLPPEELMEASSRFEEVESLLNSKIDRWLELSERV